jgi:membrane associated rhomboid family serine protease
MSTLWQNIQHRVLRSNSKLNLLIGLNIGIYLLVNIPATIEGIFFRSAHIQDFSNEYLLLPAALPKLLTHFWTPLTYMFMHAGIFHILFNMLGLYWFGQIFEEYLGNKRTIGLYLMGGFTGALFFILAFNTLPIFTSEHAASTTTLVGASAATMAIIVATATLLPDFTISLIFIGPVKLKWLALFFVIVDFLSIIGPNAGGELSHLGGAFIGFVYIKRLQKGNDWIDSISNWFKPKSKLKVVSKNSARPAQGKPRQEEVDFILDKISKSGYDNLSKQEKEVLFRASKNE